MTRLTFARSLLAVWLLGLTTLDVSAEQDEAQKALTQEARQLVARFAGQLKPQLKQALQSGGPPAAISVCAEVAPAIAANLSLESGWSVRRTSDKNRNLAAVPDSWEQARIDAFKAEVLANETLGLEYSEQTEEGFRYAKAQLTESLCLMCHGKQIADSTVKALNAFYPNDRAQGYELGEVRGIFSLLKPTSDQ